MSKVLTIGFALYPICTGMAGVAWLLFGRIRCRRDWMVAALVSGSIVLFAFLGTPWSFTSHYLRSVLLVLFGLALLYSYRRLSVSTLSSNHSGPAPRLGLSVPVLVLFLVLDALLISSQFREVEAIQLSFPMASGTYSVVQGGNNPITNPFHAWRGNQLALDIVELNRFGNRASGISPSSLEDYVIFGEELLSPCNGTALRIRGDLPDNPPGRPDTEHPKGNHVVIDCGDSEVTLAHLMQSSLQVSEGEVVKTGQVVGRVGNSGNTIEPHLHISAERAGRELGLHFEGRLLTINSLIVR